MKILFVLTCVVVSASAACKYSCSDHTMCIYPNIGPKCTNLKYSGVTKASDKQAVVDEHNRLRRIVAKGQETRGSPGPQPGAQNMKKMQWSDEIATVAQRWANQCSFGHDSCRNLDYYVGQNVYISYSRGIAETDTQDWKTVTQALYKSVSSFIQHETTYPSSSKYNSGTGHYTQIVWANTHLIGCGFSAWTSNDGWFNKYYVCNYGPGGNIISTSMYTTGSACGQCSNSCNDGLCV
ncbi:hypothetical protein L9F63_014761 [Diploptera punctata]|uniref:SCP domain-containing protein n=1 Tax=Diploptera punctata TaxID=6984 RepID=A0AAD8EKL3_DIPPU|nr:hypothetical protein L9F63_014761 [Diploptera punctata]